MGKKIYRATGVSQGAAGNTLASSNAVTLRRPAEENLVIRAGMHRRLIKLMNGHARLVLHGENRGDPIVTVTVTGAVNNAPVILSFRKINLKQPVWYLTLKGRETELKITKISNLISFRQFAFQCATQLELFLPPMREAQWLDILREALSRLVVETREDEYTNRGKR